MDRTNAIVFAAIEAVGNAVGHLAGLEDRPMIMM